MKKLLSLVIWFILAGLMAGCGGAGGKDVKYTRGPMPEGGDFDGVYQSDFGRLEITVNLSGGAVGLYEKNDEYGRIEGEVRDNLLNFTWVQWNEEMRGKVRETRGRGVFQYVVEEVPTATTLKKYHQLKGWWGYEDGSMDNPWNASKLSSRSKKRLKPYEPEGGTFSSEEETQGSSGFDESETSSGGSPQPAEEEEEEEEAGGLDIF